MPIPRYSDIVDLIKKGATLEAQEKIIELREAALELQEENIRLKEELSECKKTQQLSEERCASMDRCTGGAQTGLSVPRASILKAHWSDYSEMPVTGGVSHVRKVT